MPWAAQLARGHWSLVHSSFTQALYNFTMKTAKTDRQTCAGCRWRQWRKASMKFPSPWFEYRSKLAMMFRRSCEAVLSRTETNS